MPRPRKLNGAVLYEGPSLIDGKPIYVVAVGLARPSQNSKTGWMAQTYIMRQDIAPWAALHAGEDVSVCGGCSARGRVVDGRAKGRFCYVNVAKACGSIHKAYLRGSYYPIDEGRDHLSLAIERMPVRLGTYGEPTAVPFEAWTPILYEMKNWTGYTHQWRTCDPRWKKFLMASADTPEDREEAKREGWRVYRVRLGDEPRMKGEIVCPGSEEAGYKTTCERCRLCSGTEGKGTKDVVNIVHGIWENNYKLFREQLATVS